MAANPGLMRKQYLVSEENIKKIQNLANSKGASAAKIVRLAIDAYDPAGIDTTDSAEIMELVSTRLKEAISATRKANRRLSSALKDLHREDG